MSSGAEGKAEQLFYGVLVVAAGWVLWPLLPWLLVALWVANLTRGPHARIQRLVRGSGRGAAIIVVGLSVTVLVPLVLVVVSLSRDAVELGKQVMSSEGGRAALANLVSDGSGENLGPVSPRRVVGMVQQHGDRAWKLLSAIVTAATNVAIGLLLFLYGTYTFLVDGPRAFEWSKKKFPFRPHVLERIAGAFDGTGRGLFIGVGATGLIQATIATVTYLVLGVPRALVLGLLTFVASIVPSFGTALVWVPLAAGLAITGRTGAAIALTVVGIGVVGTVDNLVRPMIAHRADANLPTFVVMVGMFGGLAAFGAWGLLLGPLLIRLAMEALSLHSESTVEAVPARHT